MDSFDLRHDDVEKTLVTHQRLLTFGRSNARSGGGGRAEAFSGAMAW